MPGNYATALGEEIGWRGFLAPRTNTAFGFAAGTLFTGVVWGLWHMPLVILGGYHAGGALAYEIGSFMLLVVSISGILAWLRTASGSLWPAATLHAAHNLIIQKIFDPLTTEGTSHVTMVGEFGVLLAMIAALASVPFWVLGYRSWRAQHPPLL
nr:CPBP family intramembrane glutamic endopeptidase [Kordiimonas marina]